ACDFFFSSRRRHTRFDCDWSSDVWLFRSPPIAHGRHAREQLVAEIAARFSASSAQIMLAWAIAHDTVPIPKTTDAARMKQNLDRSEERRVGKECRTWWSKKKQKGKTGKDI